MMPEEQLVELVELDIWEELVRRLGVERARVLV
jgi:hypothetical protein